MKKTKKLLAALLAALLCVTALPFYALAAEEPDLDANTGITVGGSVYDFKGSGTEEDPYFYEFPYRKSSQDSLTIYTNNPAATANGETGEWTTALEYGWNEIYITVVSSDKSATAYYHLRWSRTKQQRTEKLKAGDAYTQPATNADSADGKILALDPAETYEWCVNGTNEWTVGFRSFGDNGPCSRHISASLRRVRHASGQQRLGQHQGIRGPFRPALRDHK